METKLKVKTESLAERCEVCHQSDLFDPKTGYCIRCKNTAIQTVQNSQLTDYSKSQKSPSRKVQTFGAFLIGSLLAKAGEELIPYVKHHWGISTILFFIGC